MTYKFLKDKSTDVDESYFMLKCDDLYLSILVMPKALYDKLSDLLIQEDVDYFWGLQVRELTPETYNVLKNSLFQHFGKKVKLSGTDYYFLLIGSLPEQILPYIKMIK